MRGSMFSTRKIIRAKHQPKDMRGKDNIATGQRPLTATRMKLCTRDEQKGAVQPRIDKGTQNSLSLIKPPDDSCALEAVPESAMPDADMGPKTARISLDPKSPEDKRTTLKTVIVTPVPMPAEPSVGSPRDELQSGQNPLASQLPERHSDIVSWTAKTLSPALEKKSSESPFKEFVQKIYAVEQKCVTARPKEQPKVLQAISSSASFKRTLIRYQTTPWHLSQSKLEPVGQSDLKSSEAEPEQTKGYVHGMYKPPPLLSSELLMRRIEAKNQCAEKLKTMLGSRDQEIFDLMEQSRTELLKHAEWFRTSEAQKVVYLMLTNIEDKWLQPNESEYLRLLMEERRKVEQELRERLSTKAARYLLLQLIEPRSCQSLDCKIDMTLFEQILDKERALRKVMPTTVIMALQQTALVLEETKKGIQSTRTRIKHLDERLVDTCASQIWSQYRDHKPLFDIIVKKMRGFKHYSKAYKGAIKQLDLASHDAEQCDNSEVVVARYKELWEIICQFFTSREYLATYNPVFLQVKTSREKDDLLDQLFEIRAMDVEMEFYEVIIHLMYKQILCEKMEHLRKLYKIIMIQKKWKQFKSGPRASLSPKVSQTIIILMLLHIKNNIHHYISRSPHTYTEQVSSVIECLCGRYQDFPSICS